MIMLIIWVGRGRGFQRVSVNIRAGRCQLYQIHMMIMSFGELLSDNLYSRNLTLNGGAKVGRSAFCLHEL